MRPTPVSPTARLERVKQLADDLSRMREGDPARHDLADSIKQDLDAVLRALRRQKEARRSFR